MTTNPDTFIPGCTLINRTDPDAFAPFKRGDKALCLHDFGASDWVYGTPPRKDQIYVVRDYHWGNTVGNAGTFLYGQVFNLEGVLCDKVPLLPGAEWGWFHGSFRKVTEEEIAQSARASEALSMEGYV